MASLRFPEFTPGVHRIGCLEEWSSEESTKFLQLRIAWLIRGSQVGSCVSTLQINAMGRGCFTSYRLVWDPGDFTTYRKIRERFTWRDFADIVLGHMGECMTCQQSRSGHTHPTGLMQSFPISGPRWEGMLLDCITGLPRVQSTDCMCAGIDQLSEFTHFLVISSEYGETWVTKLSLGEMFRVHEQPRVIVSDQDNKFLSACWQELFRFAGTGLTSSTSFYPQTDGQEEMVNQRVERYLHDYVRSWIEWLHLGEHCCDTTHDSLQTTQIQQRMYADRHRVEHNFEIGDMVFLRVQPHRPFPLRRGGTERMRSHLCGPYKVIQRVGEVAYELEFPEGSPDS
jgi:hypothetical protein